MQNSDRDSHYELESRSRGSAVSADLSTTTAQNFLDRKARKRRAIIVVIASFMTIFTACGLNFAFGVYQELYENMGGPFEGASPAEIDLIGTLSIALMMIGAPITSGWIKTYSPRSVTIVGGFVLGLALVLASFGTRLWHFILAQGLLFGIGTCMAYITPVTVSPGWFDSRRALAAGIISAGTGVGGVFWAPVLRLLNEALGFRNALRLTGAISFLVIGVSGLGLDWDPESKQRHALERNSSGHSLFSVPLVNWRIVKSRTFAAAAVGGLLQAAAYYTPVYFFSSYARTLGYSSAAGANFIAVSNATNAGGKVVIGWLADRYGRQNILFICTLLSAVATLGLWLPSTTDGNTGQGHALFIAFTILYGVFASPYIALIPPVLVELFGVQNFTSVNGFLYMLRGVGALIGTPVAGAMIRGHNAMSMSPPGSYLNMTILIGVLLAASAAGALWARLESAGMRWRKA